MTVKEAEQFMADPLANPDEEVLVESGWLQKILREHQTMTRTHAKLNETHKSMQVEIATLKHHLMVARSTQPYTRIVDTRA